MGVNFIKNNQIMIIYNKTRWWVGGWVDGWVDGRESRVKDCLQQSINEQWVSDDQEHKIKTTLIINYLFYLHYNWYVKVKYQIGWMDGKAGWQQSKSLVTESIGGWMDG